MYSFIWLNREIPHRESPPFKKEKIKWTWRVRARVNPYCKEINRFHHHEHSIHIQIMILFISIYFWKKKNYNHAHTI